MLKKVTILAVFAVVVILSLALMSFTRIKYGTVALPTKFGRLTGETWNPGLHMKWPLIMGTVRLPTQVRSYETSGQPDKSKADFTDYPITAQTVDGQQVEIKYTVIFRVPASGALNVAEDVGDLKAIVENVIKARSRNLGRTECQTFEAEKLYSGEGITEYQGKVEQGLRESFIEYGIELDSFLVRKIDFDESYVQAIEQQQIQQEAIETERFKAQQEVHKKQARITAAEGEREEKKILAEGDAAAIRTKGEALRKNPEVIQLMFVEKLDNVQWGFLPTEGVSPLLPTTDLAK